MIIDSHLHLPPVGPRKDFQKSKSKLILEMDKAGINYAIVIPDSVKGSNIGDLNTVLNITEGNSRLFTLGVLGLKLHNASWLDRLDDYLRKDKIKGVKIFPGHEPVYPTDNRFKPFYKLCVKYDYPLVIHTGPTDINSFGSPKYNDPKYIIKLAEEFPKLKIVISHYFWPKVEYCYKITRGFNNISFDTSALADEEVSKETGGKKISSILEKTLKDNPKSVLFGTDFSMCSFKAHLGLVNSLNISESVRKKVLWENASEVFKLNLKNRA